MSVLKKLQELGLDVELESLISEKLEGDEGPATSKELLKIIDSDGLNSPKIMKSIGLFQREGKLKPGLFKDLVALTQRMSAPSDSKEVAASVPAPSSGSVEVKTLTEKEEEKIKARVKKEEEKIRERLKAREQKMRERMSARAEGRAVRKGMKIEDSVKMKENFDAIKQLRAEVKERREKVKALRDEIKAMRPKREKKPKADKEVKSSKPTA